MLNRRFEITNLSFCNHYLDITIIRNRVNKTFYFSQNIYIDKVLLRFDIKNCKKIITLINVKIQLNNNNEYQTTMKKIKQY